MMLGEMWKIFVVGLNYNKMVAYDYFRIWLLFYYIIIIIMIIVIFKRIHSMNVYQQNEYYSFSK